MNKEKPHRRGPLDLLGPDPMRLALLGLGSGVGSIWKEPQNHVIPGQVRVQFFTLTENAR